MNKLVFLIKKELKHYFNSPIAYVIMIAFLLISGWFFVAPLFLNNISTMDSFFMLIPILLIFFIPAVSMRLFAEEKRQGTLETLETLPITDTSIVLSKFFGGLIFMLIVLIISLVFPITLSFIGKLNIGVIMTSYIGTLFMIGAMLSYGMFVSSLTKNQIVAFIISLLVSAILIISSEFINLFPSFIGNIIDIYSFNLHFISFTKGILDIRDLVFFTSIIVIMVFLTKESLDQRNN